MKSQMRVGYPAPRCSAACSSDACTSHLVNIEQRSGKLDCTDCLRSIDWQESWVCCQLTLGTIRES